MNASTTLEKRTRIETHSKIIKTPKSISRVARVSQTSTTGLGHVFSKFIDRVTIRPNKQLVLPIGNTFTGSAPKGFSIGLSPGNSVDELVDMQVITLGTPQRYEYKLVVTNNGHKPVCAEIWAL